MESFKLNNGKEIKIAHDIRRLQYYYQKFKYKVSVKLPGVQYFRSVYNKQDVINRFEKTVFFYNDVYTSNQRNTSYNYEPISLIISKIGADTKNQIISLFDAIFDNVQRPDDYKVLVSLNKIEVYTNNTNIIKSINQVANKVTNSFVIELPGYEQGVVYLKNPKSKHRLFLRWKKLEKDKLKELADFVDTYAFYPCPSLKSTIHGKKGIVYRYVDDQHFVDFNDESLITIFSLKFPDLVRKICRIEKC